MILVIVESRYKLKYLDLKKNDLDDFITSFTSYYIQKNNASKGGLFFTKWRTLNRLLNHSCSK